METTVKNETVQNLYNDLQLPESLENVLIQKMAGAESKYLKDLRINVSNVLNQTQLNKKESYLLAYAVVINENRVMLQDTFEQLARQQGATDAELAEIIACTSLMNVNNVYYRFKHFANKDVYNQASAGIKMSIMLNPVNGKEFFELLSLMISAINGCEQCVRSHEEAVLKHGTSETRVLEAIRLGSVIKGFVVLF